MELEEEKFKIRRYLIIGIVIVIIVLFLSYLIKSVNKNQFKTSNFIKQEANYTIQGTKISSYLPVITIEGTDTASVNKEIREDYDKAISSKGKSFNYQYNINKDYFSLVTITLETKDSNGYTYPVFKTYNFSLATKKLITDEELLNQFNKTYQNVSNSFEMVMKKYYQGEIDKYYLNKDECNYDCFLKRREINSYDENNHLYVENNKLKFFHGFMIFSNLGEEKFYKNINFLYTVE